MSSSISIEIAKLQVQLFQVYLQAKETEVKKYDADWLKDGKTVYRQGGRFASPQYVARTPHIKPDTEASVLKEKYEKSLSPYTSPLKKVGIDSSAVVDRLVEFKIRENETKRKELKPIEARLEKVESLLAKNQAAIEKYRLKNLKDTAEKARIDKIVNENIKLNFEKNNLLFLKTGGKTEPYFDLEARAIELGKLVNNQNEIFDSKLNCYHQEKIQWRKQVIEAELKYGKIVDELNNPIPIKADIAYERLLKKLNKTKTPLKKATSGIPMSKKDTDILMKIFNTRSSIKTPEILRKGVIDRSCQHKKEIEELANADLKISIGLVSSRGHANEGSTAHPYVERDFLEQYLNQTDTR